MSETSLPTAGDTPVDVYKPVYSSRSLWRRLFLLLFLLIAFARLVWQLDLRNLWWDESLSLLRAESDWPTLLLGRILLFDGINTTPTTDQHPFGFFVLLGVLVRLAGQSEFVLRFPATMASLLLLPALWVLARALVRRSILPPAAPVAVVVLAALNPFYLYYGQEARMYTLVAFLAVLTTYLLLRWSETAGAARRRFLFAYGATTLFFLTTHYFAVLLLPVQALILYLSLMRRSRRAALLAVMLLLLIGLVLGLGAAWIILSQSKSGRNFQPISLAILAPDLLNAFSLGLSVNIVRVWWLDLIFGGVALLGAAWGVRRRRTLGAGGWLLPAAILTPILLLVLINTVQPAYMNARHMALISGFYLILVAGGLGLVWRWHPLAGAPLAALLAGGMIYSTINYYTLPEYSKDDFQGVGDHLRRQLAPGDLLLLNPPELLRLYRYYLPLDEIERARALGSNIGWQGVPLLAPPVETPERLPALLGGYRRIWLVTSGMFPFADPERMVEGWLNANTFRIRERSYRSTESILELDLYLPGPPLAEVLPSEATPVDATFGGKLRLVGYQIDQPLTSESAIPVTFYWRSIHPMEERYKYLVYLEHRDERGDFRRLPVTEREPYDGYMPTIWWPPDAIVVEQSTVTGPVSAVTPGSISLWLQIYNADTLEKLPIESPGLGEAGPDGVGLKLPFLLPAPDLP